MIVEDSNGDNWNTTAHLLLVKLVSHGNSFEQSALIKHNADTHYPCLIFNYIDNKLQTSTNKFHAKTIGMIHIHTTED